MKTLLAWAKRLLLALLILSALVFLFAVFMNIVTNPSNSRDWVEDQKVLPYADIEGNSVLIHNIRNFSYSSAEEYVASYYNKTFDLGQMKKVWYVVEPFSGIPGSAHTFLSFEFEDDQFVSISVEVRKEKGEAYSPIKGLFNQYELIYVIADERDAIKLRSNYRKDLVYVYPVKTTEEKARQLFISMLERANELKVQPEFYNTVANNCTTSIVKHVGAVTPGRLPLFNIEGIFPAMSDKKAYSLGLIDTELSFDDARKRFLINDKALLHGDDADFSIKIREE